MRIFETHHRVKERREAFKIWDYLNDILCHRDYEDNVVSSFSHKK